MEKKTKKREKMNWKHTLKKTTREKCPSQDKNGRRKNTSKKEKEKRKKGESFYGKRERAVARAKVLFLKPNWKKALCA